MFVGEEVEAVVFDYCAVDVAHAQCVRKLGRRPVAEVDVGTRLPNEVVGETTCRQPNELLHQIAFVATGAAAAAAAVAVASAIVTVAAIAIHVR